MSRYKKRSRQLARQHFWEKHDRESYTCPDCGRIEDDVAYGFEVHHKNGKPMDNRPENHIALCRTCHNIREGKKPSMGQIQRLRNQIKSTNKFSSEQSGTPKIYLAGSMDDEGTRRKSWRASVAAESLRGTYINQIPSSPVGFNSPTEVSFEHGGDSVDNIAKDDLSLVDSSDAIVAYFEKTEQVGTLTELVYAVTNGMPALVLFSDSLVNTAGPLSISDGVFYDHTIPVYWFLINFLQNHICGECEGDVEISVVESKEEIKNTIMEWGWHKEKLDQTYRKHASDLGGKEPPKDEKCKHCGHSFNTETAPPICDDCIRKGRKI